MDVLLRLAAVSLLLAAAVPVSAGVSEQWYVLRGRSNMKIGNYRAAIEAWQKALEANPANREASRELVAAYEKTGETDRAVEQADRYLARFNDDAEMAFRQARILGWKRYAYRRADAAKYYRLGLARQDDPARRHELARLLARDRATLDEALAEYRALLAREPANRGWRDEYLALLAWEPRHRGEAIAELERRAAESPNDAELHLRIARLAAAEPGRLDDAARHYRAALAVQPGDRKVRVELARNLLRDRRRRGEAIEEFHTAVQQAPTDRALRLEYARLLAGEPERRDEALAEYGHALAGGGPFDARVERAELLAADPRRREEATEAYQALAREAPRDARVRLGYARLLGGKKETTGAAIAQYGREAEAHPRSAEAHAGLARAFAWEGDRDRALDHANQSLDANPRQAEIARLREELSRGREPAVGAFQRTIGQRAGDEDLLGLTLGARAARDVTAYVRAELEAGGERQSSGDRAATGGFAVLRVEARPSPATTLDVALGWRGVRSGDAAALGALGLARRDAAGAGWRARVERSARDDSYAALVGDEERAASTTERAGLATDNRLSLGVTLPLGAAALDLAADLGAVTHASAAANPFASAAARLSRPVALGGGLTLRCALGLRALSYAEDHSALPGSAASHADGYFSPELLVAPGLEAALAYELPFRQRLELTVRPAAQLVRDRSGTAWQLAGDARASWWLRAAERLALSASALAGRAGGSYERLEVEVGAALLF